ncbi:MAG: tetratricopeptide repeat protein [Alphaproteobacteria bacterium]|nr:tetratricopeptide repeat protein [Alphaproteobacteria bacterium]
MTIAAALLLAMQVGPNPAANTPLGPPPELEEQRARSAAAAASTSQTAQSPSRLVECLRLAADDAESAYDSATSWRANARGAERAQAAHCQGLALVRMERYAEARDIFSVARGEVGDDNPTYRARLGAMAGNAAMAGREASAAIPHFERAIADANSAGQSDIASGLEIDLARALVAAERPEDAIAALDRAREADPSDPRAWLLSAKLARQLGRLMEAQRQIEQAATLSPRDPTVGLEAGVIAALSNRPEDARRSFESVLLVAPDGAEAERARAYLAQLSDEGNSPQ